MKKQILFLSLFITLIALSTIVLAQQSNALLKIVKDDNGIKVFDMKGNQIHSSQNDENEKIKTTIEGQSIQQVILDAQNPDVQNELARSRIEEITQTEGSAVPQDLKNSTDPEALEYLESLKPKKIESTGPPKPSELENKIDPEVIQKLQKQGSGALVDKTMNSGPDLSIVGSSTNMSWIDPILTINVRVINKGTTSADHSYVGYYLSTNTAFSTVDYLIGYDFVTALSPGSFNDESFSVNLTTVAATPPLPTGTHTYYVGFILDYTERVSEDIENNAFYFPSTQVKFTKKVEANLTFDWGNTGWNFSCPNVNMNTRVENTGTGSAGSSILGYYLSTNTEITTTDTKLGSDNVSSLTAGAYSNQTFTIDICTIATSGTYYLGWIIDETNVVVETDESDNDARSSSTFTLDACCGCEIHVTQPNGGENWLEGSTHNIEWTSSGTIGNVMISYSTNSGANWTTIINSTPNDGSHQWTLPQVGSDQTNCRVRVEEAANNSCMDISDDDFTIEDAPIPCSITVNDPNGGESWYEGSTHNIHWSTSGTSGNVKISYSTNGGANWSTITSSTANDGSYAWTLPQVNSDQTQCRVKVENAADANCQDMSNNNFTIKDSPPPCSITVTDPNGGESWYEGSTHNILWSASGTSGNVKISYSTNGGANWSTIIGSTANDGSYSWTLPQVNSDQTQCRVKVENAADANCQDISNNNFTIKDSTPTCSITVTDPNGGESGLEGSTHNILWNSTGTSGNVKILYSTNGGGNWNTVVNSTPDDGTHPWILPSVNSDQTNCLVRIEDVNDAGCNDQSDDIFTIRDAADGPPICIVTSQSTGAGSEFWVDVTVGSSTLQVTDLAAVAFELFYTNTNIIDYMSYEMGPFITNASATVQPDDANGKVSASVYRTDGNGNSGNGTVIRLKFKMSDTAPTGESVCFNMGDVQAQNKDGAQIPLGSCDNPCVEVGGCVVWPGDADNDGCVDIFDILAIVNINNWDKTGPARPNASTNWEGQSSPCWTPESAGYCDCNGNGKVDIFDILVVVGPNYGKCHTLLLGSGNPDDSADSMSKSSLSDPPILIEARDYDENNSEFWVDVIVGSSSQPVSDLKSLAFELTYSNTLNIDYDSFQMGSFLSGGQATVMPEDANGKVSAAVYRLSGTGESGAGVVLSIKFKADKGHNVDFSFPGVQAEASDGSQISLSPVENTLVTKIALFDQQITKDFTLIQNYPNPFNPETTIEYTLPKVSDVTLTVFDVNGRIIRNLVSERKEPGHYSVMWNARDNNGKAVSSGVYFYQIEILSIENGSQSFFDVKKMILMK